MTTEIKKEEKPQVIYKPAELSPLGQEIYDFCRKFPMVIFNAPPDYQEEFLVHYAEKIEDPKRDSSSFLKRMGGAFYQNKPINDFLEKIENGTHLLFLMEGKKDLVTVVAKVGKYYCDNDFPKSCRIDFHKTNGFKKHIGETHVWSGHILAITVVDGLENEMVVLDPDAKIFFNKASTYAVTADEYYQRNFRIKVLAINSCFNIIRNERFVDNQLFRVMEVFGGKVRCAGIEGEIFPGLILDKFSLEILAEKGEVIFQKNGT